MYLANIVEEELQDWVGPEDPEADVETEDESAAAGAPLRLSSKSMPDRLCRPGRQLGCGLQAPYDMCNVRLLRRGQKPAKLLPLLSLPDAAEGEGGEGAAEGKEGAGDADAAAEGEAGSSSSSSGAPPDYSNKLLRYVAASPGQDFLKSLHLRRPKRPEDDSSSEAEQKPEPVPITFRVLDERLPLLEVRFSSVAPAPQVAALCTVPATPCHGLGPKRPSVR